MVSIGCEHKRCLRDEMTMIEVSSAKSLEIVERLDTVPKTGLCAIY